VRIRLLHFLPAILFLSNGGLVGAQDKPFPGVIRGALIECDAPGSSGQLALRAHGTNQVYRFAFDSKTYMEREERRISASSLQNGDTIEVVSDRDENVALHYARTIHVVEARPAALQPVGSGRYRLARAHPLATPIDLLAPRGNLTFAGVIARLSADRMVLHTRLEGQKTILLRGDTRYLEGGTPADPADLKPNTRVFIRAGRNLEDQIEAYQIVWGQILEPTPPR